MGQVPLGHNTEGIRLPAIRYEYDRYKFTGGIGVLVNTSKELGSSLLMFPSLVGSKTFVHIYIMIGVMKRTYSIDFCELEIRGDLHE